MPFSITSIISFIVTILEKFSGKKLPDAVENLLPGHTGTTSAPDPNLQTSIGLEKVAVAASQPEYTDAPPEIAAAIRDSVPVSEAQALGPEYVSLPPTINVNKSIIDAGQLRSISGCDAVTANKYVNQLNDSMKKFSITESLQVAHFLAQIMHESGAFRYTEELSSGAQYEGRKDLGNVQTGDGIRFKGRGLVQITGRANYQKLGEALHMDLLLGDNPKLLAGPDLACLSAAWFWNYKKDKSGKNLNDFALFDDAIKIVYFVNGGFNGLQDRLKYLKKAYTVLGFKDANTRIEKILGEIGRNIDDTARSTNKAKALFAAVPSHKNLSEMKVVLDRV